MEAIPRLPMLCFETKPFYPKNCQFGPDLMNLIRQHYQEDPNNYVEEIQQLEKLRQQAVKLDRSVENVATLKRYFCQLYFLQKRFPSLKDVTSNTEVSWKDLLSSSNSKKFDYRSEFTTTLYNIGVLHTQLGASEDRNTEEGLKMACTHFQCAAWAFQYLRDVTSVNARPDFDHGYLEFVISTCLAQAQECIAEKSISDNRKPNTSARIVAQICEYYQAGKHGLARLVQEDSIFVDSGVKCPQVNLTYLKYKLSYYRSITNLFMGMQAEEDEKMGERVAYFEQAVEEFHKARQHASEINEYPLNKGLDEAMSFIHDIVEGKHKNAVSENNFIYHEEVPPKDKLQRLKGASLVKCISFDFNDPEISGLDIFAKLISMKAHELSSVYSEEKAKLLRSVGASVEEKEAELHSFMQSFKLDYLSTTEDPNTLPEELIERCAACEAKPMLVQELINSMNKLADAHHEVAYMMKEIMALIDEEEKAEDEFQVIMGTNRPPSIVTTELKCEANRYQDGLKRATESNESLRDAIAAHVNNLKILSLPLDELQKQLPRISLEYSPEERSVVTELQRLVDKVDEMKNQRALLMLRLRESLRNDDITDRIVLNDEDKNEFSSMIVREIAKHHDVVNLIEQNLKAQSNILKAMTSAYASYAPIRKIISETAHKRGVQINALIESFDVSDDVLQKTAKGLEFYRQLEVNARKLLSRVKGTCKVQEEERCQTYAKTGKKPPSRHSVEPKGSSTENTKPMTTVPKLKDYITQARTSKTIEEISYPYNPYNANGMSGYVPTNTLSDSAASSSVHYSSVVRPAADTSESNLMQPVVVKSHVDASTHSSVPAAVAFTGYTYPYYNAPVATHQTSSNLVSQTSSVNNTYSIPHGAQNVNSADTYHDVYAVSSSQIHGYSGGYNSSDNRSGYSNSHPSVRNDLTLMKPDSVIDPSLSYATPITYTSTVPDFSYSNSHAPINPYSTGYQVASFSAAMNVMSSSLTPSVYSSASNSVAYTASYSPIMTTASDTSYLNLAATGQYTTITNSSAYSSNPYLTAYSQIHPAGYNYSNGISSYAVIDTQNSNKEIFNSYPMSYNHNASLQYSCTNDPQYLSVNQRNQEASSNLTNFPNVDTYNSSFYTNAGPNVSSTTINGRYYESQFVSPNSSDNSAVDMYYMSQYGHQQLHPKSHDTNTDQFVSRENDVTDRLQAKRNSMTYIQAGKNCSTVSTYSVNTSNVSSEEKKEPSNIDLLADLDFNVSDVPLMPSKPVKKSDEITDKLSSSLNTNSTNTQTDSSSEKISIFSQLNPTLQPELHNGEQPKSTSRTDVSKLENTIAMLSIEKGAPVSETELSNRLSRGEESTKSINNHISAKCDTPEVTHCEHTVDPLSSIDALWPLKKEQS